MINSIKVLVILLVLSAILLGLSVFQDTSYIRIEYYKNISEELTVLLSNLRLAHVSDLHTPLNKILEKELLLAMNKINPDFIIITGDFISDNESLPACSTLLSELSSIAPIISTYGNNDHSYGNLIIDEARLEKIVSIYSETLLINTAIILQSEKDSIYLVGLDDNVLYRDDYFSATLGIPDDSPKILLAHSPDIATKIKLSGIKLILCGHTHSGQIKFPILGSLTTNRSYNSVYPYTSGFYELEGSECLMYVNRGIGTSDIPIRFLASPEIAVFDF